MVVLATVATVIASQAVISGAFSVTRQAVQLGFLPRLSIRHTSAREIGQVYAPAINWVLFVAVVGLVLGFGSSTKLASAYGIAVTGTITVDTILFLVVVRALWRKPTWMVAVGALVFFTVDLAFLGANVPKVAHGGWFPLSIGLIVFLILSTWKRGAEAVRAVAGREGGTAAGLRARKLRAMDPPAVRVPGTAVYLNARRETTPLALRASLRHSHTLHETVVIISIESTKEPHVAEKERLVVDRLGYEDDGICHLTARIGFQDTPDVPGFLRLAAELGLEARDRRRRCRLLHLARRRSNRPPLATWLAGASGCSRRWRATPPARSTISACRSTARSRSPPRSSSRWAYFVRRRERRPEDRTPASRLAPRGHPHARGKIAIERVDALAVGRAERRAPHLPAIDQGAPDQNLINSKSKAPDRSSAASCSK